MTGVLARYEALVAAGDLAADPDQARAARALQDLQNRLATARKRGLLARLLRRSPRTVRGVYLWGGVGRGKSMLMDLFHETLPVEQKRRAHFHEFMQEVHTRLRAERARERGDPIGPVAAALAKDLRCLAFDEMVVTNSADAMIMSRLFRALICDHGLAVVTTSNRPPADLYLNGLNREHFLPFIALIEQQFDVQPLNGPVDYRVERLRGLDNWFTPLGEAATAQVREAFLRATDHDPDEPDVVTSAELRVSEGRSLHVPRSYRGVAVFSFKRLCGEPRGAADYLAIARAYQVVIIVGIPRMGRDMRNEAARFVTLIDALYEYRVKLYATAEVEPEQLYEAGDGSFEFARTVSRLAEMRSDAYLALGHGKTG